MPFRSQVPMPIKPLRSLHADQVVIGSSHSMYFISFISAASDHAIMIMGRAKGKSADHAVRVLTLFMPLGSFDHAVHFHQVGWLVP